MPRNVSDNRVVEDVSLFIITDDIDIVPVDEWDRNDNAVSRFVLMTNERLNAEYGVDNSMCVSKRWTRHVGTSNVPDNVMWLKIENSLINRSHYNKDIEYACLAWQTASVGLDGIGFVDSDNAKNDMDGFRHTMDIVSGGMRVVNGYNDRLRRIFVYEDPGDCILSIRQFFPAVTAAYDATEEIGGKTLHGFLPSIGQMYMISQNSKALNDAFALIGADILNVHEVAGHPSLVLEWTSSSCFDDEYVWHLDTQPTKELKSAPSRIFPVFSNIV